jgi:hypothetical protein
MIYVSQSRSNSMFDTSDEAIPAARNGLDESRLLGVIFERRPQAFDCCIYAVFELHNSTVRPKKLPDLLARHDLPWLV